MFDPWLIFDGESDGTVEYFNIREPIGILEKKSLKIKLKEGADDLNGTFVDDQEIVKNHDF